MFQVLLFVVDILPVTGDEREMASVRFRSLWLCIRMVRLHVMVPRHV